MRLRQGSAESPEGPESGVPQSGLLAMAVIMVTTEPRNRFNGTPAKIKVVTSVLP